MIKRQAGADRGKDGQLPDAAEPAQVPSGSSRGSDEALLPIVRADVLPCLHAKFGVASPARARRADHGAPAGGLDPALVDRFTGALIDGDTESAWNVIESLRALGASPEWIVIELLPLAALRLGERWEDDTATFSVVTIAMSHLSGLLRRLSAEFVLAGRGGRTHGRLLMAPAPGEQHSFGLSIASEFFVRAGFDVHTLASSSLDALLDAARTESFDAVGLSMGALVHRQSCTDTIRRLRSASRNRSLAVMVGGAAFTLEPGLARQVGADLMVGDVRDGPVRLMRLVRLLARRYGR